MARFSASLIEHFQAPSNRGPLAGSHLAGVAGVPGQGRFLAVYLRLDGDRVEVAGFDSHVCGVTVACGSLLTELCIGRSVAECARLTPRDIAAALDGVPPDKGSCADYAILALHDALRKIECGKPGDATIAAGKSAPRGQP